LWFYEFVDGGGFADLLAVYGNSLSRWRGKYEMEEEMKEVETWWLRNREGNAKEGRYVGRVDAAMVLIDDEVTIPEGIGNSPQSSDDNPTIAFTTT
jgi:hypothetical protein